MGVLMRSKLFLFILLSVFSFKSLADVATAIMATAAVGATATLASIPIIDKLDERKELRNELYNLNPIVKAIIRNDLKFLLNNINKNNVNDKIYGEFSLIHMVSLISNNTSLMDWVLSLGADPNQRVTLGSLTQYSFTPIDLLKYNFAVIAPFPAFYIGNKDWRQLLQRETSNMLHSLEKFGGTHTKEIEKLLKMPEVKHKLIRASELIILTRIHDASYLTKAKNYEKLVRFSQNLFDRDKLFLNFHTGYKESALYQASASKFKSKEKYAKKVLDNEYEEQKKQEQKNNSRVNCKNTFSR